jgi:hypothetical protein
MSNANSSGGWRILGYFFGLVSGVVLVVSGERLTRPHKDGSDGGDRESVADAVASDNGARVATPGD